MKKLHLYLLFIACVIIPSVSLSQANSVTLLDGSNNVISTHSSIQEAYNAIPSTLAQAYEIELAGSYNGADESFPVVFISKPGASAANTISVTVASGVTLLPLYYGGDTSSVFIFDDADWMIINGSSVSGGAALSIHNSINTLNFPLVHFKNGSCNNILRRCSFSYSGYTDSASAILMGSSPGNSSGNSDNLVDHCNFSSGLFGYITSGSINSPNRNNRLYRNIIGSHGTSIWQRGGTGKLYIDSNRIDVSTNEWVTANNNVVIENLTDSLFFTKNRLKCYTLPTHTILVRGVYIRSTSGPDAYLLMTNNYIRLGVYDNQFSIFYDSLTYAAGIEFDGATEARADIYHNTIRIRGMKSPGSSALAFTTSFKTTTSNNSVYNIENNIFTNERFGGTNATNVTLSINNTAGTLNINNNTYNSFTPNLAQYNNILYTTMAAYQAAVNTGNETNSNNAPVEFVNVLDHRLYNTSINNPLLQGIVMPGITEDIEGDTRVFPYRGCDEYEGDCVSNIYNVFCSWTNVCPDDTIHVWHIIPFTGNGNVYQWQSRPAGTTQPFTDIPGAIYSIFITAITQSTDFRIIDSCATGGLVTISNIVTVNVLPLPSADGIAETHNGLTYDFNGINVQNTNTYQWDFGDGSGIDTNATPQHTYGTDGTYTVTLIITNNCGSDTVTLQVNTVVSVPTTVLANEVLLYPNPATNATTITCGNGMQLTGITVYNITGATVSSVKTGTINNISINTSSFLPGLYMVRIETDRGSVYKPLQVMR